jgi:hypothetical protein
MCFLLFSMCWQALLIKDDGLFEQTPLVEVLDSNPDEDASGSFSDSESLQSIVQILKSFPEERISFDDVIYLAQMKDDFVNLRTYNPCVMCKNRTKLNVPLGMLLCCLQYACIDCAHTHFDSHSKVCSNCSANLSPLKISECFLKPISTYPNFTTNQKSKYRLMWKRSVELLQVTAAESAAKK